MALFNKIENIISTVNIEIITKERRQTLQALIDFIQTKVNNNQDIRTATGRKIQQKKSANRH